ncbi:hypothetical protein BV350_05320 [Pseudomonas syringae pv. actinidiae]|nr:hypothetical protein BV350_05320 [Pseudomonas syringae pv. actinidiae]
MFAKRAVQSMHFCVWNTAFANKFAPTGIHELLWERTCSRRGRCSRCIFASGITLSRTSSLLQASTSFCGSELVREEGGAVDAFFASGITLDCGFHDTWTLSPRSFGHSFQAHLDTCPTSTWTGSRSAATQVCIVSLKHLPTSILLRACASIHPSVRSDKRYVPAGRGSRRPRSDRRSAHAICPPASGW